MTTTEPSRRTLLRLAGAGVVILGGGAMAINGLREELIPTTDNTPRVPPTSVPTPSDGSQRAVNYGMESIVPVWEPGALDSSGANAVSLAVGRPDWVAAPWPAHPDAEAADVRENGIDYLAVALATIPTAWEITLTIDALAPRMLADTPELAGVSPTGDRSTTFASVAALDGGAVGDRLVELAQFIAATYGPDRIALTELMFDDATFGDTDLRHFLAHTGEVDWPRDKDGEIDAQAPVIATWRSEALARVAERIVAAVDPYAVKVDMDVRAPQGDPASDRALSGHDYDLLLTVVDRIVVWNYPGLGGADGAVAFGGEVAAHLQERHPGRFVMSTGLWADDDAVLRSSELVDSLVAAQQGGAPAVSVTPASLLSDSHWAALRQLWVP
ncbi:MAG: hypothetical protein Q4G50_09030 [Corynebacterium sp.]|uniref:hypothetical protein n=1 Tax=Corynebacterium sp. TaxID=1720 RepID=UPI0026DEDC18|nr:hypothetical protein [Corynebacterium sp.]MDO5670133.1 hypothetical protein [Corynebacterium sp.]